MGLVLRQLSAIVYFEGAGYRGEGGEEGKCLTLGAEQSHITVRPALTVKSRR